MDFYKPVGILLLAVSGAMGAYFLNRSAADTLRQVEGWLTLVRTVQTQVECFALPATEILRGLDPDLLRSCGYEGEGVPESFEELARQCTLRDGETCRLVTGFCKEFGTGYRGEQVRSCAYYAAGLGDRRQTLASALPNRKKLNTTLCVSGALAVVILLI